MAVTTSIKRGYNKDVGYKIPDVVDPQDAVCIRVYVPKDSLYIGAFWRAYQDFTSWLVWERDIAHRAKDVAAVWRFWFDQARAEYDISGGSCDMANDVRQKPDSPCVLQKKVAGVWTDFADLRLCVPKMRFYNGVLQQDTTGNGDWVDARGETDPPYDERTDGPSVPAWTTPPAGQSGDCLAANNVARWIMYVVYTFAFAFAGGAALGVTISSVVGAIAAVMSMGVSTGVAVLLTGAYGWLSQEWQDIADYCVTATLKLQELMFCRFEADGSITLENYLLLIQDLEEWRDTFVSDSYQARTWNMIIGLLNILGPVGLTRAGAIFGVVEADCGDYDCGEEWEHVWDFETGAQGWELYPDPWDSGVVSGGAWHSETTYSDSWRKFHYISVTLPEAVVLTSLSQTLTLVKGLWDGGGALAWAVRLHNGASQVFGGWEKAYNDMTDATDYEQVITTTPVTCDKIELFASCSKNYEEATGTFDTLSVKITGTGTNPWE